LDCYLHRSAEVYFNTDWNGLTDMRRRLNIIHLHGTLQNGPWQSSTYTPYGSTQPHQLLLDGPTGVKIIHEDMESTPGYMQLAPKLMRASTVYFIGFGFHPINLSRLLSNHWHRHPRPINSCAYGMGFAELTEVERLFGRGIKWGKRTYQTLQYMREVEDPIF